MAVYRGVTRAVPHKKTEVGPPYTKFIDKTVRARVGISRETLEKRLEKTSSNARCFAQDSSLMC
jgi:hypothetical protein